MHRGIALAPVLACACHVTTTTELTRPTVTERIRHGEGAIARPPTLVLTDAGALRFVEPLECPTEEVVATTTSIEEATGPNLATFVVGVIVTAVGGVMTVRGVTSDDRSNLSTYAGAGALVVGLPLGLSGDDTAQTAEARAFLAGRPHVTAAEAQRTLVAHRRW